MYSPSYYMHSQVPTCIQKSLLHAFISPVRRVDPHVYLEPVYQTLYCAAVPLKKNTCIHKSRRTCGSRPQHLPHRARVCLVFHACMSHVRRIDPLPRQWDVMWNKETSISVYTTNVDTYTHSYTHMYLHTSTHEHTHTRTPSLVFSQSPSQHAGYWSCTYSYSEHFSLYTYARIHNIYTHTHTWALIHALSLAFSLSARLMLSCA